MIYDLHLGLYTLKTHCLAHRQRRNKAKAGGGTGTGEGGRGGRGAPGAEI